MRELQKSLSLSPQQPLTPARKRERLIVASLFAGLSPRHCVNCLHCVLESDCESESLLLSLTESVTVIPSSLSLSSHHSLSSDSVEMILALIDSSLSDSEIVDETESDRESDRELQEMIGSLLLPFVRLRPVLALQRDVQTLFSLTHSLIDHDEREKVLESVKTLLRRVLVNVHLENVIVAEFVHFAMSLVSLSLSQPQTFDRCLSVVDLLIELFDNCLSLDHYNSITCQSIDDACVLVSRVSDILLREREKDIETFLSRTTISLSRVIDDIDSVSLTVSDSSEDDDVTNDFLSLLDSVPERLPASTDCAKALVMVSEVLSMRQTLSRSLSFSNNCKERVEVTERERERESIE